MTLSIKAFLHNPWIIMGSMALGGYIGVTHGQLAAQIAPLGELYLALLQMCVLPIMITAVIIGLGKLVQTGKAIQYFKRMTGVYISGLIIVSIIVLLAGIWIAPSKHLTEQDKAVLSEQLANTEDVQIIDINKQKPAHTENKLFGFIQDLVPSNIFAALSKGQNMAVLFFCLILGISLGKSRVENTHSVFSMLEGIRDALLTIVGWTIYALPFGLCCILAGNTSSRGIHILMVLSKLVILYYLFAVVLMLFFSVIIWRFSNYSYWQCWKALKEPLIIAFSTRSSFATIPSLLKNMHEKLAIDEQSANLLVPVGVILNPLGSVMHYSLAAVFITQLYAISFSPELFIITIISVICASVAAAGIPTIATLSLLAIVLEPLGAPINVAIMLFAMLDSFIDPVITLINVHGNSAAAIFILRQQKPIKAIKGKIAELKPIASEIQP